MSKRVHELGRGVVLGASRVCREIREQDIDRVIIRVGRRIHKGRIRWSDGRGIVLWIWENVEGGSSRGRWPSGKHAPHGIHGR